jgi:hypothetical protein
MNAASYNEQCQVQFRLYFTQQIFFEVFFFMGKLCGMYGVLNLKEAILILALEEERCVSQLSLCASGLAGSTMPTESDRQRCPFRLATSFDLT